MHLQLAHTLSRGHLRLATVSRGHLHLATVSLPPTTYTLSTNMADRACRYALSRALPTLTTPFAFTICFAHRECLADEG